MAEPTIVPHLRSQTAAASREDPVRAPTAGDFLLASAAVYDITGDHFHAPQGMKKIAVSRIDLRHDGFAAVVLRTRDGNIIIANKSTEVDGTRFGKGTLGADHALIHNRSSGALIDARRFSLEIQKKFKGKIYVTGHSLGGTEAEAECAALASDCAGGMTFGATGLPGTTGGGPRTLVNIVDFGDTVGNYASDRESALNAIVPAPMAHYGITKMVGARGDGEGLERAAAELGKVHREARVSLQNVVAHPSLRSFERAASAEGAFAKTIPQFRTALDHIARFHPIGNYAADLRIPFGPGKLEPFTGAKKEKNTTAENRTQNLSPRNPDRNSLRSL